MKLKINPPSTLKDTRVSTQAVHYFAHSGDRRHRQISQKLQTQALEVALKSLPLCLLASPALAAADAGSALSLAVGGGVAITALSAALVATDPSARGFNVSTYRFFRLTSGHCLLRQKNGSADTSSPTLTGASRRRKQTADSGGNEKEAVRNYFNTKGFERWKKIYGQTEDVNKVQLDIREGHAQTVDKVLQWLDSSLDGTSICDAGCGTGSLAIPLALRGAAVSASDISRSMAEEARQRYESAIKDGAAAPKAAPQFTTSDLESLSGKFDIVACLDVMIHYPQEDADKMIAHLASLAEKRLIISFAPKTLQYTILKRIGELFPGPAKATRAYLHAEADIEAALKRAGFKIERRELTATSFYFSRLLEAVRV